MLAVDNGRDFPVPDCTGAAGRFSNLAAENMAGQLAIVAYRCLVGGVPTNSLDFRILWFSDDDAEEIRRIIEDEPFSSYANSDGESVLWELVQIFAIEPFEPSVSGEEIVGFIATTEELTELA